MKHYLNLTVAQNKTSCLHITLFVVWLFRAPKLRRKTIRPVWFTECWDIDRSNNNVTEIVKVVENNALHTLKPGSYSCVRFTAVFRLDAKPFIHLSDGYQPQTPEPY